MGEQGTLWRTMYAPTGVGKDLAELRHTLSLDNKASWALEKFLYSQWANLITQSRLELNQELKTQYASMADALSELAGTIFAPANNSPEPTKRRI